MTNEEIIKGLTKMLNNTIEANECGLSNNDFKDDIELLKSALSLIEKQEKEIDILKNHVHYKVCENCKNEFISKRSDAKYCKECAKTVNNKEWYKNLTDEQKEKRREQSRISMRNIRERRKQNDK